MVVDGALWGICGCFLLVGGFFFIYLGSSMGITGRKAKSYSKGGFIWASSSSYHNKTPNLIKKY